MKKTTIFGLIALLVVGMFAATATAYRGDYTQKGPDYSGERHELMENAFDSLDYDAWKSLMTENGRNPRVVDVVTESNFNKFVEAHEAAEDGDYEKAAQIRAELGLNNGNGPRDGTGHGKGMGQGKGQRMQHNDGNYDNYGTRQGRRRQ